MYDSVLICNFTEHLLIPKLNCKDKTYLERINGDLLSACKGVNVLWAGFHLFNPQKKVSHPPAKTKCYLIIEFCRR